MINIRKVLCCDKVLVSSLLISIIMAMTESKTMFFPEQNLPSVSRLKDGQSTRDKYLIIRLMNLLERQKARQLGLTEKIPWSLLYAFEGDIILQKAQALKLVNKNKSRKKRKMDTAVTSPEATMKWPLPINYVFDKNLTSEQKAAIRQGINHWEEQTCIRFTNDELSTAKRVKFIDNSGCYSYVGNNEDLKEQVISIGKNCTRLGIVAHEIGHVLGFWHEHAREDRVDYLHVNWDNVMIGEEYNFNIRGWDKIDNLGIPYDFGSVMHYSSHQFSKGDYITMETLNPLYQNTIGQRQKLSFFDAKLANNVYCNETCTTVSLSSPCQHEGYQDPNNCTKCRCPDGLAGDFCQLVAPSNRECGGTVELRPDSHYVISSPGYPNSFEGNIRCYWLIRSPNGTAINIQFSNPFMQSQSCVEFLPHLPCVDYVEVRFAANLGVTGGRFCCNTDTAILESPIVTHSNHALILFKTYSPGNIGISANLTIDSCGGCYNSVVSKQPSCTRKVTKYCYQTWNTTVALAGCSYYFWGTCSTSYRIQEVRRLTQCYTEESYCCEGYTLSSDDQHCLQDSIGIVETESTTSSTDLNTIDPSNTDSPVESDQGTSSEWTAWSLWKQCSETCGGCGNQTRSRTCLSGTCTGDREMVRTCGETACNTGNVQQQCSRTYEEEFDCFMPHKCSRTVTEYYSQAMTCCCGYTLTNGICAVTPG